MGRIPRWRYTDGDAENFMRTMVVYTHGLATLAATHGLKWSKEEAYSRMNESVIRFLQSLNISKELILKLEDD